MAILSKNRMLYSQFAFTAAPLNIGMAFDCRRVRLVVYYFKKRIQKIWRPFGTFDLQIGSGASQAFGLGVTGLNRIFVNNVNAQANYIPVIDPAGPDTGCTQGQVYYFHMDPAQMRAGLIENST